MSQAAFKHKSTSLWGAGARVPIFGASLVRRALRKGSKVTPEYLDEETNRASALSKVLFLQTQIFFSLFYTGLTFVISTFCSNLLRLFFLVGGRGAFSFKLPSFLSFSIFGRSA